MSQHDDRIFLDTNRLRYDVAVDEAARTWWRRHFLAQFGLSPEDVGDALSASWPHDKRMVVTQFDGITQRFSVRVEGSFGEGEFWFHARTLDIGGSVIMRTGCSSRNGAAVRPSDGGSWATWLPLPEGLGSTSFV